MVRRLLKKSTTLLLILLQVMTACHSDRPATAEAERLDAERKQQEMRVYETVLGALGQLQFDPLLRNADLGYMILDVTTGDPMVVADHNAASPMVPASTLKLFVTGAALEYLGEPVVGEVMVTNQMSVNWRSSKLLRRIGGKVYNRATTEAGARAVLDFWSSRGVDTRGMYFYDGNGLSRSNAISPKQLVEALRAMQQSPWYETFYASLPLAGISGTLHKAMKGSAAEGRVHAKTGTIGKVKSFAGYVDTRSGRRLIFSLIVNNFECRPSAIKKKLEEVMIRLAEV